MLGYFLRRLLYNVPVFLGILLVVMVALRVNDPAAVHLGKDAALEDYEKFRAAKGLDDPFPVQYARFLATFELGSESWDHAGVTVGEVLSQAIWPTLAITLPALVLTAIISILIGLVSAFHRGRPLDRTLVFLAVMGMSISFLVYIVLGQYFGAFRLNQWLGETVFAVQGFNTVDPGWWVRYCLLPVLISTIVAMGYDTRYYRTVMVEETTKDHIRTARAKGIPESRVMFKHMLRNAMVSIVTRIMITLPFLITGSILGERFFNIPGMGRVLITAIKSRDFPVVQGFTAIFAVVFIVSNILTDVLYGVVDPRVRLS